MDRIDTLKTIETPEGVELRLATASFFSRGAAWLLDAILQTVVIIILLIWLPQVGDFGMGLFFVIFFLISWFYPVFFEVVFQGQTPGKKAMGIQVVGLDGVPVDWRSSLIRNLLRTVDFLPSFYALGFFVMLLNKNFQRLGDLAAHTIVVHKRRFSNKNKIVEHAPFSPSIPLTADEQQAIVSFAERFNTLSPQRAEELARIASPLLESCHDSDKTCGTERLLGVANYLVGRR